MDGDTTKAEVLSVTGAVNLILDSVQVDYNQVTRSSSDAAIHGSGLYADNAGGSIEIRGGRFYGNQVKADTVGNTSGGAIYLNGGSLTISGTTFIANDARGGNSTSSSQAGGGAAGGAIDVDNALVTLAYNGGGFSGDTNLTISTNDKGNTGTGGELIATSTVALKVAIDVGTLGYPAINRTGSVSSTDSIDRY